MQAILGFNREIYEITLMKVFFGFIELRHLTTVAYEY